MEVMVTWAIPKLEFGPLSVGPSMFSETAEVEAKHHRFLFLPNYHQHEEKKRQLVLKALKSITIFKGLGYLCYVSILFYP